MHIYHPIVAIIFKNCNKRRVIKLPIAILFWLLLACVIIELSGTMIISNLIQSKCLDKRFAMANDFDCKAGKYQMLSS